MSTQRRMANLVSSSGQLKTSKPVKKSPLLTAQTNPMRCSSSSMALSLTQPFSAEKTSNLSSDSVITIPCLLINKRLSKIHRFPSKTSLAVKIKSHGRFADPISTVL